MKVVRPEPGWRVVLAGSGRSVCLPGLALKCGYRVGEICEVLGCSGRYLYEVFMRDTGLSPKDWLRGERMVVARRMLAEGKAAEEVALVLGFSSRSNFSRELRLFGQEGSAFTMGLARQVDLETSEERRNLLAGFPDKANDGGNR
jgi:AraC-like DNA-binding protein